MPIPEWMSDEFQAQYADMSRVAFEDSVVQLRALARKTKFDLQSGIAVRGGITAYGIARLSGEIETAMAEFHQKWNKNHGKIIDDLMDLAGSHAHQFAGGSTVPDMSGLRTMLVDRFRMYSGRFVYQAMERINTVLANLLLEGARMPSVHYQVFWGKNQMFKDLWKAGRVQRTEGSTAYNEAIKEIAEHKSKTDPGIRLRWTELVDDVTGMPLDNRVGKDSIALHGQIRKTGEAFSDLVLGRAPMSPPNRPHDRARLVVLNSSQL